MTTRPAEVEPLQERVAELERRLDAVTAALLALVQGLEGTPMNEQELAATHSAARLAHERLLAASIRAD